MSRTQNNTDINATGSCESEDEWVCNDDVVDLRHTPVTFNTPVTFKQLQNLDHLPNSPKNSLELLQVNPCRPAVKRIKTMHNRRVWTIRCSIPDEQLQGRPEKLPVNGSYLPAVLVNPRRPAVKRIKTEYNRRVSVIRCSIPDAYHKIRNLNYAIRTLTAPAAISRAHSELNKNHAIILTAQCQMRTAHQEKKRKLENIKTHAIFRYLTSKDKKTATVAKFHQWSPFQNE